MILLFLITAVIAILIPYEEGSLTATLHLLFSYLAFFFFNAAYLPLHLKYSVLYEMTLILCALLCFSAGKITGLSELIFACMVSILIAIQLKHKKSCRQ